MNESRKEYQPKNMYVNNVDNLENWHVSIA